SRFRAGRKRDWRFVTSESNRINSAESLFHSAERSRTSRIWPPTPEILFLPRVEFLKTLSSRSQPGAPPNGARFVRDGRPFDDIAVWKMDGLTDADPAFGGAASQPAGPRDTPEGLRPRARFLRHISALEQSGRVAILFSRCRGLMTPRSISSNLRM